MRWIAFRIFTAFVILNASLLRAQAPLSRGEHVVVVNGIRLWYKVAGRPVAGQAPLVYLHGGPGYNSYSFEKTTGTRLESHVQMVYVDERGSGRSERPWNRDYALPTLVEDVEGLRKSLGVKQISLLGHSFGGTIAAEYAAKYPAHVQRLIVMDGAEDLPRIFGLWRAEIEERYPAAWEKTLRGAKGEALREAEASKDACAVAKAEFNAEMEALDDSQDKVDSGEFHHWQQFHDQRHEKEQHALDEKSGLRNTGEMGSEYFKPDGNFPCYRFTAYGRLTMPVLVMVGRYDGAVGVEQMREFAARLPNARLDVFEDSGHFPYAEEPERFTRIVTDYLGRRSASNQDAE